MAPTMGIEQAREGLVDSRRGAEKNAVICIPQEAEMGSGLRKESQGERQTDRRPGSLCLWDSAKMGGVGTVQWIGRVAENTTNSTLDNGVLIKAL